MANVPAAFTLKKNKILRDLSTPVEEYSDLSPKGSVDIGIRRLIDEINGIDGLVTTSSCAGRMSVFLDGAKVEEPEESKQTRSLQAAVPGGKGRGGRWLFVSHDPVSELDASNLETNSVTELFGLSSRSVWPTNLCTNNTRFVKFQFEPMVIEFPFVIAHHN